MALTVSPTCLFLDIGPAETAVLQSVRPAQPEPARTDTVYSPESDKTAQIRMEGRMVWTVTCSLYMCCGRRIAKRRGEKLGSLSNLSVQSPSPRSHRTGQPYVDVLDLDCLHSCPALRVWSKRRPAGSCQTRARGAAQGGWNGEVRSE